jgi:cytochrome d ubiquinol oxidase subunit II
MLIGAGIMIPIILAYSGWSYWVFRGKAGATGYH